MKTNSKCLMALVAVLSCFCASTPARAGAARRGVQAVLLELWTDPSVDQLASSLKRSVYDVEVAEAPYFTHRSDPYRNIRRLIQSVAPSKRLMVTIHLSFHDDDPVALMRDAAQIAELRRRAGQFDAFARDMNASYPGKLIFKLSPMLEDKWSASDAKRRLEAIASALTNSSIGLRRSYITDGTIPSTVSAGGRTFSVQREQHGPIAKAAGDHAWSNDGIGVNIADVERLANNPPSPCTSVLLWRYAYNGTDNPKAASNPLGRPAMHLNSSELALMRRWLGVR